MIRNLVRYGILAIGILVILMLGALLRWYLTASPLQDSGLQIYEFRSMNCLKRAVTSWS
jgi:hypothetical protein